MIPANPLSGGDPPSACSTDSDSDPIERQRYAQQQLCHSHSHSHTENTTQENHSSPLRDGEQNQAVLWQMPSYERTRSESVLLETQKSPLPPSKKPQADDFIPQMPLLSLLIRKRIHSSRTPAEKSLLPISSNDHLLPVPIAPLLPLALIPKIPHPISVMGTIINSPSTLSTPAVSQFHPLAISSLEAIFHIEDPQPHIPALVGLPLWMRQYSNNNKNEKDSTNQEENEMVRQLWICANFDDPGFGTAPSQIGSKLVMRKDGVNLLPQHLEALCQFCIYVLQESCGGTGTLSSSPRKCEEQKQIFQKMATMRGFVGFWREYSEERAEQDERWKGLPSPYDRGKLGMWYEWLVPTGNGGMGGERSVWKANTVGETTRTEGLVTRGLARKREVGCEADGGAGRRRREFSEASSEESDILPPSKRRTRYSGKSVTKAVDS